MRSWNFLIRPLMCLFIFMAPFPGNAQNGGFSLELNNARDVASGCRLTYVAVNGTGTLLEQASYEVVIFDGEGTVAQFLVLEFGRLTKGKTKVVQFDLASTPCKDISKLLINDAKECLSADGPTGICLESLETKSRTKIAFSL